MIRINLLAAERPTEKKGGVTRAPSAPGTLQATLLLVLFLGSTLAACGLLWFLKNQTIKDLGTKIAAAEKRQKELQVIKAQVEAFERKKALLDAKVKLIEKLKSQQSGPVHMLDEVSKALPEFVWLEKLDQTGNSIVLEGQANSLTSVADLITALQRSGWFPKVELNDSREEKGLVKFKVTADFKNISAEATRAAQAAAAPAAAAAPGAAPAARP